MKINRVLVMHITKTERGDMVMAKEKKPNILVKIADEYYITKNYNYVIIFTYLCMAAILLIGSVMRSYFNQFENFNAWLNHYNTLITASVTILAATVPFVITHIHKKAETGHSDGPSIVAENSAAGRKFAGVYSIDDFETYYSRDQILDRKNQVEKVKRMLENPENDDFRWIYLTGDSGAGKSTILKLLQKELNAEYFSRDYYDMGKMYEKIVQSGARYVFLDQFETALKYKEDILTFFNKMKFQKVTCILSFRKEFMVDVEKILGHRPTHIVIQDDYDKEKMRGMLRAQYQYAEKTDIDSIMGMEFMRLNSQSKIIRILFEAINSDELQMIAFEIIGTILEQGIDVEEFLQEEMPPAQFIDTVIDYYFRRILPVTAKEKITMLSILYLLSKDRILAARFYMEDFKNITFSGEEEILDILDKLGEVKFVKKVDDGHYEIAHDFIAGKVLYIISSETMNADIAKNIDYYFHHIYLEKYAVQKNKIKEKLKRRYQAYNSAWSEGITNLSLFVSCFLSLFFFLKGYGLNSAGLDDSEKCVIVLLVGLSVFYVYNFFMNFIKMFPFFWIPELASVAAISVIFVDMKCWIVCLGAGITVVGLSHAFILRPIDWSARKYLQKNCILFSCFGLAIAAVGVCELMFQSSGYVKYFWYLFYFLYIMGAIMGHITPDYFAIRIGKANALKVAATV